MLDLAPTAYWHWSTPQRRHILSIPARAQSGAHSQVSFAIEPIQLPIVPLSLLELAERRSPAALNGERGADRSRRWAAQSGAERRTGSRGP